MMMGEGAGVWGSGHGGETEETQKTGLHPGRGQDIPRGQEGPNSSPTSTLAWNSGVWGAVLAELEGGGECGWRVGFAPPGAPSFLGHSNPSLCPAARLALLPFSFPSPAPLLCY